MKYIFKKFKLNWQFYVLKVNYENEWMHDLVQSLGVGGYDLNFF